MISAILRAQLLSMRSLRLDSGHRGPIFSIVTALIWYGFWAFIALAAAAFTSSVGAAEQVRRGFAAGLMLVFLYWQIAPVISASLGASLDLKKLLVYPVPHRKLFVIELLLRVTAGVEMLLVLGGAFTGLLLSPVFGGVASAPRILAPALVFAAFNILLSAGTRNLLERLLTHKRLREVLMLLLATAAALPQLLIATNTGGGVMRRVLAASSSLAWPWTAAARVSLGRPAGGAMLALVLWTAAAYAFGRWQFERVLRYDAQSTARSGATGATAPSSRLEVFYRLPSFFLPDPLSAAVEKELRALGRTPRFRMVFIMGFSFGLLVWLPVVVTGRDRGGSVVANHFLTIVAVYALTLLGQVSYLNSFGFDRSAAQMYFSAPVPIGTTLAGKNIASFLYIMVELGAVTFASLLMRVRLAPGKIAEAFAVTAIVALYLLAIGNLSSIHYPRAMNPERVSQGGAASRMQALIFVFYPAALAPVLLAFWARSVFESDLIFSLILAFAAALGAVVYWIAMESAIKAAIDRREKILIELSRSEGPVEVE